MWQEDERSSICAFVLNIVAHFVTATKSEEHRAQYMTTVLDIMGVLHMDILRIVEQLKRARAFLFESKKCEAFCFDAMNALVDSVGQDDDQHTSREDLSKDGVHELIKHMPLGLLGSGLDDGSPMKHLSGLERVTLANCTNEQRAVLLGYARACFDARLDGLGSDMGPVELVPWKALSDATVRGALKRLPEVL